MIDNVDSEFLITLTSDIVEAHVSGNSVAVNDVAILIANVHAALASLDKPAEPVEEKPKGAVSIRASVKPDALVSMIDGKSYKMLKRHLSQNGYTPDSYRETFGLQKDYPMTAASYSARRKELAMKIGLGRKKGEKVNAGPAPKGQPKPRKEKPAERATVE